MSNGRELRLGRLQELKQKEAEILGRLHSLSNGLDMELSSGTVETWSTEKLGMMIRDLKKLRNDLADLKKESQILSDELGV